MESKVFIDEMNRQTRLSNIISLVANHKDGISIADITKKLQLNRSTLRHYLKKLIDEKKIRYENKNDLQGRPVFVHINRETYEKEWKEMERLGKEWELKMKQDPITKAIISFLSKKKRATNKEVLNHVKALEIDDMYISRTMSSLNYLRSHDKVVEEWRYIG